MSSTESSHQAVPRALNGLTLGPVELTVRDLDGSVAHYTELVGAQVVSRGPGRAELGVGERTFVVLREERGLGPAAEAGSGLSHVALEVPGDADVARFARHLAENGRPFQLVDHDVSLSCYVSDDDGHTVEVTHPHPEDRWRWRDGFPILLNAPVEVDSLSARIGVADAFTALPSGTDIGHVQLRATDAGLTEPLYCDVLGLTPFARLGDGFLGVGVESHRSLLVFTTRFGPAMTATAGRSAALVAVTVRLSDGAAVAGLADRLRAAGVSHEHVGDVLSVADPSGNPLRFVAADR